MRRSRLVACVLTSLAAASPGCRGSDARPNVLLVVVDTLRADQLGSYGHPRSPTPNLDALAAGGVLFERAVAASSRTAPSHASIMTSRFVNEHSIGHSNGGSRLVGETTLADVFAGAGYDTAAFVSNYMLRRSMGLDRGFEVYDDELGQVETNRPDVYERIARDTTARALAWLESTRARPWFVFVHYQDPHGPYEPPPPYDERFDPAPSGDEIPLRVRGNVSGGPGIPEYQLLPELRFASQYRARYLGEVAYTDEWIGKLLRGAEAWGRRPLVVLMTSDHGESLGEDELYFLHGEMTLPSVSHVPFVVRAPGLEPGRRKELVHHVDVLPTLLGLAGLPVPEHLQGLSLGPLLEPGGEIPERILYSDIGTEVSAYHGDRFVRVRRATLQAPWQPSWQTFDWNVGAGTWTEARGEPRMRAPIAGYLARRAPLAPLEPLSEEERDRLRALGYLPTSEPREE
jgi:arylsulfatase A-like enzyme